MRSSLAGVFTKDALSQLESLRFTVLHFPYENIVRAFQVVNINAYFDEKTPDAEFAKKVTAWESLRLEERTHIASTLISIHEKEVAAFIETLKRSVTRQIESVRVLPLYGHAFLATSIEDALTFVSNYKESITSIIGFVRYEIELRYMNGDMIKASFQDKERVIEYLRSHTPAASRIIEQIPLFEQEKDDVF